jgi:hypothetical protein
MIGWRGVMSGLDSEAFPRGGSDAAPVNAVADYGVVMLFNTRVV